MPASANDPSATARCPICRKETVVDFRPFCSKRCADIDLGKWFSGGYAIGGRDGDDDDGTPPQPATKGEWEEGE